jgi:hypothetical protein
MTAVLPSLHTSTLRRGYQAAAALTAFADALRAAGDVEGVAEAETCATVLERRLERLSRLPNPRYRPAHTDRLPA